ncbi:MAG: hypothetical protein LBC74_02085 [Planctomycetaceae bacterium]|jgi:hypothetical protein|nr:hypothetical protein [Planctomycetaceae bacterium]
MPYKDIEEKRKHVREYCRRLRQDPAFYKNQLKKNRKYYQNARNNSEKLEKMRATRGAWRKENSERVKVYKKRYLNKLKQTDPEKYKKQRECEASCRKYWRRYYYKELKQTNPEKYKKHCDRDAARRRQGIRRNRTVRQYMKQTLPEEIKELKRRFVETIEKSAFIGITAKHLEIPESRVYSWMKNDVEFETAVRNAQQRVAEKIGLTLINKAIQTEDTQALIFLCRTLGRNLGFDEKQPIVNINMNSQPEMDLSGLSFEEKDQLLSLMRKTKQSEQIGQDTIDV